MIKPGNCIKFVFSRNKTLIFLFSNFLSSLSLSSYSIQMTWVDIRVRILTLKEVDHVSWLQERKGGSYQTFQTSCFRVKWNIMQLVSTACNKCYYVPIKQNIDDFNSTQNIDNYIWWHDSNKFSFPSQSLVQFSQPRLGHKKCH